MSDSDYKSVRNEFKALDLNDLDVMWGLPDDDACLIVSPLDDAIESLTSCYSSGNADGVLRALAILSVHILHNEPCDPSVFQDTILAILLDTTIYQNSEIGMVSLHLLSVISTRNSELLPQMASVEFLDFCLSLLDHENTCLVASAFVCIHNLIHEGPEWRDLVLSRLPIELLWNGFLAPETDPSLHAIVMRTVSSFAFYEVDSETANGLLSVCVQALSSTSEELFAPAMWALIFMVDLCPGIGEVICQPPFLGLVELMTYSREPELLIPALRLARHYLERGMLISKTLCTTLVGLLGHLEAKVSKIAYECLKLIDPGDIERLTMDSFLEVVAGVFSGTAFRAKLIVADVLCTVLEKSRSSIPGKMVELEMLPLFLEMMEFGDAEITARAIGLLARFMRAFDGDQRVYWQLIHAGAVEVFEELIDDQSEISEIALAFASAFLQPINEPEPARLGPPPVRIIRFPPPEPVEREARPRLWVREIQKPKTHGSESSDSEA
jgi:hypothetical protein